MSRPTTTPVPRGSTLLLAMILLAVLSIIGVAAVTIAGQDRSNVGAIGIHDKSVACANAAQMVIYSELAKFGLAYITGSTPIPTVTLPDGTTLSQAHYDTAAGVTVQSITPARTVPIATSPNSAGTSDLTNTFTVNGSAGQTVTGYQVVALCTDAHGRKQEVEFVVTFPLSSSAGAGGTP